MELKLIVSGVPSGESIWGAQSDSAFVGSLYISSKENHKFDVRLYKSGNTIYAYYHYLIYNNLNEFGGRAGGYFCLTVRLDSFCVDYKSIYNILDTVFRKRIVGSILAQDQGNRLQYSVPSFDKAETELLDIEKYIRNSLGACLTASDFKKIPSVPSGDGVVRINSEEATARDVMQAVGQYGSCSISPEYVSRSVTQQLKEEYRQGASSRQGEINKLQEQIASLESELSHIKEKESQQKKVVTNNAQQSNVAGYPERARKDAHYERNQGMHHHHRGGYDDDDYERSSSHTTLCIFTALIVFLLAIISLLHFCSSSGEDSYYSQETPSYTEPDSTKKAQFDEPLEYNNKESEKDPEADKSKEGESNE